MVFFRKIVFYKETKAKYLASTKANLSEAALLDFGEHFYFHV